MYCPKCRNKISDKAVECPSCGADLRYSRTVHSETRKENRVYSKKKKKPTSSPLEFGVSVLLLILVLCLSWNIWNKMIVPKQGQVDIPSEETSKNSMAVETPSKEIELPPQTYNAIEPPIPKSTNQAEQPPISTANEHIVETEPPIETAAPNASKAGSVLRSAGELRIRSGPSTSYEDIGRLKGGTPVTIYEQQQEASGRWWGRMDEGWVCMDYIVFGEDTSELPSAYADDNLSANEYIVGIYGNEEGSVSIGYNEYDGAHFAQIEIIGFTWVELSGYYDSDSQILYLSGTNVLIANVWSTVEVTLHFYNGTNDMTLVVDESNNEFFPKGETIYYTRAWHE